MPLTTFRTDAGWCGLTWTGTTITGLQLPSATSEDAAAGLRRRAPAAFGDSLPPTQVRTAIDTITRYFGGDKVEFDDFAIDISHRENFATRIYQRLRQIGWGCTTTYGALARDVGAGPGAARAVGRAMATNPVPLIIPCHRVLSAGGSLGGFSAPGGSATKRIMLRLEGVRIGATAEQGALAL